MNDSGQKRVFPTGAMRDSADDKPMMELLPLDILMRVSEWYTLGAKKYGDNNWRKGQPISACVGSLLRHLTKYLMGHTDEDHLSAIVFNALSMMNVDMYHRDDERVNDLNYIEQVKAKDATSAFNDKYMIEKFYEEYGYYPFQTKSERCE